MRFFRLLVFILVLFMLTVQPSEAHRSGCHSWHSCPSDSGSYTCGDRGYCSQCSDNEYCLNGSSRLTPTQQTSAETSKPSSPEPISTPTAIIFNETRPAIQDPISDVTTSPKGQKAPEPPKQPSPGTIPPLVSDIQKQPLQNPVQNITPPSIPTNSGLCKGTARCFNGTITKIIDGDTLIIDGVKVRLAIVNTPEFYQWGYRKSKAFTAGLCRKDSLAIVDQDDMQLTDKYGRMVAVVYCHGRNLNEELLLNTYAKIWKKYCRLSEFGNDSWARSYGC